MRRNDLSPRLGSRRTLSNFPPGPSGGDFTLGRKRCFAVEMERRAQGRWICGIDLPPDAQSLAVVFVDELGRTSSGGIRTFNLVRGSQ
jgi:hypothetical protein